MESGDIDAHATPDFATLHPGYLLDGLRHAAKDYDFMAPIKLASLSGGESQRHKHLRHGGTVARLLFPAQHKSLHGAIRALITFDPQAFKQPLCRSTLAFRQLGIPFQPID